MIVIAALPGRYRSTTGINFFIVSLRAAMSIRPNARRITPTPYITAPIHAIPNMMWKNRRTTAMTADASTILWGRDTRVLNALRKPQRYVLIVILDYTLVI